MPLRVRSASFIAAKIKVPDCDLLINISLKELKEQLEAAHIHLESKENKDAETIEPKKLEYQAAFLLHKLEVITKAKNCEVELWEQVLKWCSAPATGLQEETIKLGLENKKKSLRTNR